MPLDLRRAVLIVVSVALAALFGPGFAGAARSPRQVVASILAAGRAQSSVHYTSTTSTGNSRYSQVSDIGQTQGIQRVTFTANGETGHATVIVSNRALYVRGDAFALENAQGFTSHDAEAYAGQWVRIMPSNPLYPDTVSDATLPSLIHDLGLSGKLESVAGTVVAGQHVVGVSGTGVEVPLPATLYGRATGSPLPVEQTLRNATSHGAIVLGRWNAPIHIAVPVAARTISGPLITA